jgi:hypothetical protein
MPDPTSVRRAAHCLVTTPSAVADASRPPGAALPASAAPQPYGQGFRQRGGQGWGKGADQVVEWARHRRPPRELFMSNETTPTVAGNLIADPTSAPTAGVADEVTAASASWKKAWR